MQAEQASHSFDKERNELLKQSIEASIQNLKGIKTANKNYYHHKMQDGQWRKGVNRNAEKRINAVQKLDEAADLFIEILNKRLVTINTRLEANAAKEQGRELWNDFSKAHAVRKVSKPRSNQGSIIGTDLNKSGNTINNNNNINNK